MTMGIPCVSREWTSFSHSIVHLAVINRGKDASLLVDYWASQGVLVRISEKSQKE